MGGNVLLIISTDPTITEKFRAIFIVLSSNTAGPVQLLVTPLTEPEGGEILTGYQNLCVHEH